MAGNTPWQVGPGDEAGVQIPGPIGFYTTTPAAVQTVVGSALTTTNFTSQVSVQHTALSTLIVALAATGLILRT